MCTSSAYFRSFTCTGDRRGAPSHHHGRRGSGMAMRQRRAGAAPAEEPAASAHFADVVKSFDVYPKTLDDFKERTGSGAAVSVVSLSIILLLVISEFRSYLTPVTTDHLYVDTTRGERIRINLNLTFPSLPCAGLRCDCWVRPAGAGSGGAVHAPQCRLWRQRGCRCRPRRLAPPRSPPLTIARAGCGQGLPIASTHCPSGSFSQVLTPFPSLLCPPALWRWTSRASSRSTSSPTSSRRDETSRATNWESVRAARRCLQTSSLYHGPLYHGLFCSN